MTYYVINFLIGNKSHQQGYIYTPVKKEFKTENEAKEYLELAVKMLKECETYYQNNQKYPINEFCYKWFMNELHIPFHSLSVSNVKKITIEESYV